MSQIIIESGIAMPKLRSPGYRYPWAEMKVGDSFFAPKNISALVAAAKQWANRNEPEARFTARTVDGGCRIWRIK